MPVSPAAPACRCMSHKCSVACDEDKVSLLLKGHPDMLAKYQQALLMSYIEVCAWPWAWAGRRACPCIRLSMRAYHAMPCRALTRCRCRRAVPCGFWSDLPALPWHACMHAGQLICALLPLSAVVRQGGTGEAGGQVRSSSEEVRRAGGWPQPLSAGRLSNQASWLSTCGACVHGAWRKGGPGMAWHDRRGEG